MTQGTDPQIGSAPSGALLCVVAFAGLAGAAGVALAAVAAHKVDSPALATAATMLMIHAAAALGLASLATRMRCAKWWLIVTGFVLGAATLFSTAIAVHVFTGNHLFPMAAPIGGSTLIGTWLAVAGLAIFEWRGTR